MILFLHLMHRSSAGDKFVVAVHDCNQVANFMIEPYPTTISTEKYSFAGRLFISIKNVIEWLMLNPVRGLVKLCVMDSASPIYSTSLI